MASFNFDFYDWGKWGVGDFYNGNEELLKNALSSGEDFDTNWHGFKKELESMRIAKDSNGVTVSVSAYMDSALEEWDLICDGISEDEEAMLTEDIVEEIREALYRAMWADMYCEECENTAVLPASATFDEIIAKASELMEGCYNKLHESFRLCAWNTLYILYNKPEDTAFIDERVKNLK